MDANSISRANVPVLTGSEMQAPDELISREASVQMQAPAYPRCCVRGVRAICRLPTSVIVSRNCLSKSCRTVDRFDEKIRGVVMIPGSGEFVYATETVSQTFGLGHSQAENVHTLAGETDWQVALDQMQTALPNVACGVAGGELVRDRSARGAVSD